MIKHSILPPDTSFNLKDITMPTESAGKYILRPMGTPLSTEDAIAKQCEVINYLLAEVDKLKSQLNNITCIVAKMRSDLTEIGGFSNQFIGVPSGAVRKCIEELEEALAAKENK